MILPLTKQVSVLRKNDTLTYLQTRFLYCQLGCSNTYASSHDNDNPTYLPNINIIVTLKSKHLGHGGGGRVLSVLVFYCNDPSQNPAQAYSFSVKHVLKKNENKQKKTGACPFLKQTFLADKLFCKML